MNYSGVRQYNCGQPNYLSRSQLFGRPYGRECYHAGKKKKKRRQYTNWYDFQRAERQRKGVEMIERMLAQRHSGNVGRRQNNLWRNPPSNANSINYSGNSRFKRLWPSSRSNALDEAFEAAFMQKRKKDEEEAAAADDDVSLDLGDLKARYDAI